MEGLFTVAEVARITGLTQNTIMDFIESGQLKATFVDEGAGKKKLVIAIEDVHRCDILEKLENSKPPIVRNMTDGEPETNFVTYEEITSKLQEANLALKNIEDEKYLFRKELENLEKNLRDAMHFYRVKKRKLNGPERRERNL